MTVESLFAVLETRDAIHTKHRFRVHISNATDTTGNSVPITLFSINLGT